MERIAYGMVALVLAGGLGRRFGAEKQWVAMDDRGHTLTEYTLYDARQAGVDEVVLLVRPEAEEEVRHTLGARLTRAFAVRYAIQPSPTVYGFDANHPPLGTGHALLCGAQHIKEPFVLCNADDYYGAAAITQAVQCAQAGVCACIAYAVGKTVGRGDANRAICVEEDGLLTGLCECACGRDSHGRLYASDSSCRRYVREDTPVSLNLFALLPSVTATAAQCFSVFLQSDNQRECYLGDVITAYVGRTHAPIRLLHAASAWHGITYPRDLPAMRRFLARQVEQGRYPVHLWN